MTHELLFRAEHLSRRFLLPRTRLLEPRRVLTAVDDVSFDLAREETLGVVGESGSGKTTLMKLLLGLERPDEGRVTYTGASQRREVQVIFQDPSSALDPRMRVHQIIGEPLRVLRIAGDHQARVRELLEAVGLPLAAAQRYPHEFSGGQRQRIALARALMLEPKVLVADEPVSALDVSIRSQVLNLMKRLQAEHKRASVVISHDLAVVKYLADRIAVMYLGKVVELGTGDDIYRRPAHPYTDALIKTIPVPDPVAERAKTEVGIRGELPSPIDPPSGCRFRTRCPRAQSLCAEQEPLLRSFSQTQQAACHFPLHEPDGAQTAEPALTT